MARPELRKILTRIGAACVFVSGAWLLQAMGFTGDDPATSQVLWSLTAALIFGVGIGFFLISYLWFA